MVREPHHERLVPCPFALSLSKGSSNLDANPIVTALVFPLTTLGLCYLAPSVGGVALAIAETASGSCLASEITMI